MDTLLTIVHVLVCLFLVGIVLLQHGKGADIGASFGGSSQSLFGTEGPLPLLNKITTAVAILFMITSVALAYLSANKSTGSVITELSKQQTIEQQQKAEKNMEKPLPAVEESAEQLEKEEDTPTKQ